jgi:hypothetical protein
MTSTMRHWRADLPVTVFLTALFVLAIGSCATSSQTVADDVGGTVVPVAVVPADDSAAEAEAPEPTTAEGRSR